MLLLMLLLLLLLLVISLTDSNIDNGNPGGKSDRIENIDYISIDDLDDRIENEVMSSYITKAIGILIFSHCFLYKTNTNANAPKQSKALK